MTVAEYAGLQVDVDAEGFMTDASQWNEEVAKVIADQIGLGGLTDAHWKVIQFMRKDFAAEGQSPGLRRITQQAGVSMKEIYALFPKGPGKKAAMVAGLPKPKSCI
jgi:tRNA 2-thiouridine synthesizing protein E